MGRSLGILHWMGIVSGLIFLVSSLVYNRLSTGAAHLFGARHVLICLMLLLTLISQFGIIPRMDAMRASLPARSTPCRSTIPHACSSTLCTSGPPGSSRECW